jgi:hypothetical protein
MPGDGLAKDMAAAITQRRRDSEYPCLVIVTRCAYHFDDVWLAAG